MINLKSYWEQLKKDKRQFGEWATILQALEEVKQIMEEETKHFDLGTDLKADVKLKWLRKYFGGEK